MNKLIRKIMIGTFFILVFVCVVLTNKSENPYILKESNGKTVVAAVENKSDELPIVSKGYIVKEYEGLIAVFENGQEKPFRKTSILVKELPLADQELLKNGIEVENREELNNVLEDYCS